MAQAAPKAESSLKQLKQEAIRELASIRRDATAILASHGGGPEDAPTRASCSGILTAADQLEKTLKQI